MIDKEIDKLFSKQEIKLSADFNESLFSQLENGDKDFNRMFSEDKIKLNANFNDKVLDEARIDTFFVKDTIRLKDSFCDDLFDKIESESVIEMPKRNTWLIATKISSIAALLLAGVFVASSYFAEDKELIAENSHIYAIAKENIHTEIDYFLLEEEMNTLSQEIDSLSASILEIESYKYTTASSNI